MSVAEIAPKKRWSHSFRFRIYGLAVRCNRPIPGVHPSTETCSPDLTISLGEMPPELSALADDAGELWWASPWVDVDGRPSHVIRKIKSGQYYRFLCSSGARFALGGGCRHLWATWPDQVSESDIAFCLLGPVMGAVLRLRGTVCLNGSAVRIGTSAVAFLGSAAGKSTTAIAFAHAGHPMIADAVVTLDPCGGRYLVHPGYPHLRLRNETIEKFGSADALPMFAAACDKLDLIEEGAFQDEPLPLAAVYILGERSWPPAAAVKFEWVSAREAITVLVENSYGNLQLGGAMRAQQFEFLGRFLLQVPIRKLTAPDEISFLPAVCRRVVADFRSVAASADFTLEPRARKAASGSSR